MEISLYFLTLYYFAEGLALLWAMHLVKDFKEDFNLMKELKIFSCIWLVLTNLSLFVAVQGSHSGFLTLQ